MLHGQTCNESKCLVTVKAPKDRIVFWRGAGLTDVDVWPVLEDEGGAPLTLPTAQWGSDHSLLSASFQFA
jgi:hypothetical protein